LVIRGEPHPLSNTALRPRGPSVERTALANFETPANNGWRASSSNTICFATLNSLNVVIRPDLAVELSDAILGAIGVPIEEKSRKALLGNVLRRE